jgi:hypothetical protein
MFNEIFAYGKFLIPVTPKYSALTFEKSRNVKFAEG